MFKTCSVSNDEYDNKEIKNINELELGTYQLSCVVSTTSGLTKYSSKYIEVKEHVYKTVNLIVDDDTEIESKTIELLIEEEITELPTPTKTGYDFDGWYTNKELTNKIDVGDILPYNINKFYAKFNVHNYNINVSSSVNGVKKTTGYSGFTFDVYVDNILKANDVITYNENIPYQSTVKVVLNSVTNYSMVKSTIEQKITSDSELIASWITSTSIGIQFTYKNCTLILINDGKTWAQARAYAQSLGGDLAMIKSADMQNFIYNNVIKQASNAMWIGINDAAKEGTWVYNDGTPLTYTNWNNGEPNNSGDEDYGELYVSGSTGKWNDLNGTQSLPFLIQIGTP